MIGKAMKSALTAFVCVCLTLGTTGCKPASPEAYPEYAVMKNKDLDVIELSYDGVVFRPYGIIPDTSLRGNQIGILGGSRRARSAR